MASISTPLSKVSGMLEHLTLLMASSLGAPLVFDPDDSYESAAKQYRTQLEESYKDQEFKLTDSHPTIVGWRRSALRRDPGFSKRGKPTQYAWSVGRNGSYDGGTVKVVELLGQFDISFTIYTRDVEWLEDFEIKYLSGLGIQELKEINATLIDDDGAVDLKKYNLAGRAPDWQLRVLWSSDLSDPVFTRQDNSVISLSFQALVSGSFFSVVEGVVTPRVIFSVDHEIEKLKELIDES